MRKESGLDVTDRIRIGVRGEEKLEHAVTEHRNYISGEVLAQDVLVGELPDSCLLEQEVQVNGLAGTIGISSC